MATEYPREWEEVNSNTWRLRVPNGWLVCHDAIPTSYSGLSAAVSMVFVPDAGHTWKLAPEEK